MTIQIYEATTGTQLHHDGSIETLEDAILAVMMLPSRGHYRIITPDYKIQHVFNGDVDRDIPGYWELNCRPSRIPKLEDRKAYPAPKRYS